MNRRSPSSTTVPLLVVPTHWTPQQALAVAQYLQAMREALWRVYGSQMQQAWCEQLMPTQAPPEFDPDEPF